MKSVKREKSKNFDNISKVVRYFLPIAFKKFPGFFILSVIKAICDAARPMVNVLAMPYIIDELLGNRRTDKLILYAVIIVVGGGLLSLASGVIMRFMIKYDVDMDAYFSLKLSKKVMELDFQHTESKEALDALQAAKNGYPDYSGGIYGMSISFFGVISSAITIAGLVTVIAVYAPILFAIIIVTVLLNTYLMSKINKLEVQHNMTRSKRNRIFNYFAFKLTDFRYGKDIRLYNAKAMMADKWDSYRDSDIADLVDEANHTMPFWFGRGFFNAVRNFATYVYLGILTLTKAISIGVFTQMITAGQAFSSTMEALMMNFQNVSKACSYAVEYVNFMDYPDAISKGNEKIKDIPHTIEFRDVTFRYPGSDVLVLDKINITLHPGEHLSVVGLNGAGKTTFVKLLCRLYDPTEGTILLDGIDIKEYDYEEYMKLFAPVFQDFKLLAFTVRENVILDGEESDESIDALLAEVGLGSKMESLTKGKETLLFKAFDENGIEPSGGEQQKLAIARALYKDAPVVILDEPTAALDPVAEYDIYRQFDTMVGGKSAIYISHRLSSCKFCHRIAVFGGGKVCEYGTHDELIGKEDGVYAEMFRAQAQYYN